MSRSILLILQHRQPPIEAQLPCLVYDPVVEALPATSHLGRKRKSTDPVLPPLERDLAEQGRGSRAFSVWEAVTIWGSDFLVCLSEAGFFRA